MLNIVTFRGGGVLQIFHKFWLVLVPQGLGGGTCPLGELILVFTWGLRGAPQVSRGARVGTSGYQGVPRIPTYPRGEGYVNVILGLAQGFSPFCLSCWIIREGSRGFPRGLRRYPEASTNPLEYPGYRGFPRITGGKTPVVFEGLDLYPTGPCPNGPFYPCPCHLTHTTCPLIVTHP